MECEIYERSGLLGAKIRELRHARGLMQEQMAALAKVSVGSVRDLEQGRVSRPRPGSA
jgi:transcriptional regulator with XRE-family HTH domain